MTVTVEMKIKYFSTDSMDGVEYTVEQNFDSFTDANHGVIYMVHEAEQDAMADGAQMDTFYFEYDYLMDESVAIENNLMAEAV